MRFVIPMMKNGEEEKRYFEHIPYRLNEWFGVEDIQSWKPGDNVLICAGTGTGKSYFVKNNLLDYFKDQNLRVLYGVQAGHLTNDLLNSGAEEVRATLVEMHERFSKAEIEVDHLSENPHNEYINYLAPMTIDLNRAFNDYRTGIVPPYYWRMVNDCKRGKILVQCGIMGTDCEYLFWFGDLTNPEEAGLCKECFEEFKEKVTEFGHFVGSNNKKRKRPRNNILAKETQVARYTGDWNLGEDEDNVHSATDPDNARFALLKKPLTEFKRFVEGDFKNLHKV